MMRLYHCLGSLASFLFLSDVVLGASTCNTATNRACWTSDFNIATDYEAKWPVTGVTRTVSIVISLTCRDRQILSIAVHLERCRD